jgi:hypothetical protein
LRVQERARQANDVVATLARRRGRRDLVGFLCECDDPDCLECVPLSVVAYEGLSRAGHTVLIVNHRVRAEAPAGAWGRH